MAAAVKERDTAREEVTDIQDKTRKLLFKLNLSNEIEDVGLSLEHARNIVYNRRGRRGSVQQATNLPPPGSETPGSSTPNGSVTSSPRRHSNVASLASNTSRSDRLKKRASINGPLIHHTSSDGAHSNKVTSTGGLGEAVTRCGVCGKVYAEASNFEGACVNHLSGASKLYEGTKLEVWSCCKSRDTIKGCQLTRHKPDVALTDGLMESHSEEAG